MDTPRIREIVGDGCRQLLGQQQRDAYAPTHGCFDRRYWGWKLADFPDATLQRAVLPLSWLLGRVSGDDRASATLAEAVEAGLTCAARLQHRDGSFDQAFPGEHSFGATAFLLHPLLRAYEVVRDRVGDTDRRLVEDMLARAADFLCRQDETHGLISNHLAGAVLALASCGTLLRESRWQRRADDLLARTLDGQSDEGWFPEYAGADPGYQTLCVHYLAQVERGRPNGRLHAALGRAVEFLAWFAHPDGTFGGEYGSRRTAVCYPGGLALLANDFPLARRLARFVVSAADHGRTVTPLDVDAGNRSPLLESWITAVEAAGGAGEDEPLPYERPTAARDFPAAGLFVRGTPRYYAVAGACGGGVLKVFDKTCCRIAWDDGGYVGRLASGRLVTSQARCDEARVEQGGCQLTVSTPFVQMIHRAPTPAAFLVLRAWGIAGMWNAALREWTKRRLVSLLMSGQRPAPLRLRRTITFGADAVRVEDRISAQRPVRLSWLRCGRPFTSIHMATAGYFQGFASAGGRDCPADVEALAASGECSVGFTIPT